MSHDVRETVGGDFFSQLAELRDCYSQKWNTTQESPPPILYHYTSVSAAAAIVRSATLRATGARHLDDETEIVHASTLLASVVDDLRDQATTREQRRLLGRELHGKRPPGIYDFFEVFVASLTASEDDLSQWIAYGDRGCGV